jgi:hypothetical protein
VCQGRGGGRGGVRRGTPTLLHEGGSDTSHAALPNIHATPVLLLPGGALPPGVLQTAAERGC